MRSTMNLIDFTPGADAAFPANVGSSERPLLRSIDHDMPSEYPEPTKPDDTTEKASRRGAVVFAKLQQGDGMVMPDDFHAPALDELASEERIIFGNP